MDIEIIRQKVSREKARQIAQSNYGEMVKGVADLQKRIIVLGGELHADAEEVLLKEGSRQQDLWGFNLYPDKSQDLRIAYTSLINIRPNQGNRTIEIQDTNLKAQIKSVVDALVE